MSTSVKAPGGTNALAGRSVARMGFGVMQFEGRDRDTSIEVLRRAVELGVDHLDTAHFYGPGECNEIIRAALRPYPEDLVLVSKVGAEHVPGGWDVPLAPAQRPEQLREQVEANLHQLGAERLAVVNMRRIDAGPGLAAEGDQIVDLDDQLAELVSLRDQGKIGGVGLSNVSVEQLDRALPAGVECVQNAHSVLDRSSEAVLDRCRERGVPWVPFFPLGSAFGAVPNVRGHPVVEEIANELGASGAQVGLAWELAHWGGTLLIPGTSSRAHLEENVAAADVRLSPEQKARLDALGS